MKKAKKNIMSKRQRYITIINRNRQLLKVNILILSIGLALSYLDYVIGEPILWLGIIIFVYTTVSTFMARSQLKKQA